MARLLIVAVIGLIVLVGVLMLIGGLVADWIDKKDRDKHK